MLRGISLERMFSLPHCVSGAGRGAEGFQSGRVPAEREMFGVRLPIADSITRPESRGSLPLCRQVRRLIRSHGHYERQLFLKGPMNRML